MDIVSRLKSFMIYLNITSSQFADMCQIPRPTFSQLLNGRNKKISDEIITKIHSAFPELSIVWLMFNEGEMVTNSNIKISERKNTGNLPFELPLYPDSETNSSSQTSNLNNTNFSSENFSTSNKTFIDDISRVAASNSSPETSQSPTSNINIKTTSQKRITNIVVFYDDNSFESFSPSLS